MESLCLWLADQPPEWLPAMLAGNRHGRSTPQNAEALARLRPLQPCVGLAGLSSLQLGSG